LGRWPAGLLPKPSWTCRSDSATILRPKGIRVEWAGEGEWKITVDVFRDLGMAYLGAMTGIYILLVIQMNSFFMPLLIMIALPLTLIGIMPGFWLFNVFFTNPVGGFENPVFFTATSMIGMIALGGIVIRNSLVLVEFIEGAMKEGVILKERDPSVRRREVSPHRAYRRHNRSGRLAHHPGSGFFRAGVGFDFRSFRLHVLHALHRAGGVLYVEEEGMMATFYLFEIHC
jgi:hypothetical protein